MLGDASGLLDSDDGDDGDDGEIMETCSHSNLGWKTRRGHGVCNIALSEGRRHPDMPGIVGSGALGVLAQHGFCRFWAEVMAARGWGAPWQQRATGKK